MIFKAGKEFKGLKNKHFGPHKLKTLETGGEIDITQPELIPDEVLKTLTEVTPKKKKGDK